jgi:hypothetical protein
MHFLGHSGLQDKYNIGLLTILYIYYAIDSVKRKHFYFCRFWEIEIIPCLFSEYILTFMVEEPMTICVINEIRIHIT